MTVAVGFAEAFGAVEAAWSLQSAGFGVVAFARRGRRSALRRVPGVRVAEVTAPEDSSEECLEQLRQAIDEHRPSALLPMDDAALWAAHRVGEGVLKVAPSLAAATWALDKQAQIELAGSVGLRVPPTSVIANQSQLEGVRLPALFKPANAVVVRGERLVRPQGAICADASERSAFNYSFANGPLLAQPVLKGRGEGIFGLYGEAAPNIFSAHRRVRMTNPAGSASSACESIDPSSELTSTVERLLDRLSWKGLFMAEFLRDDAGNAWFMEINGRVWGSMALARRCGFEYPAWAVRSRLGMSVEPSPPLRTPNLCCRHLGRELLHLAFVARGPKSSVLVSWPSLASTLWEMLHVSGRDRLYNWDPAQPMVLAADTWAAIADQAVSWGGKRR